MPRIYRAMTVDDDNKPKVGSTARTLGVRVGDSEGDDIAVNDEGNVRPKTGGMSVAPTWRDLETHRIPKRLRSAAIEASGSNRDACWAMGEGAFNSGSISADLEFRHDSERHGVVEPSTEVSIDAFQNALAATRGEWTIDED